ncbi:TIM barrel protein [bacterium]|nr:TIM barrel protein [bacterium]
MDRRSFMKTSSAAAIAAGTVGQIASAAEVKGKFNISVAAWSWHKMMFSGEKNMLDQPKLARMAGATGLELVNQFFASPMETYLNQLKKAANDEGIKILLIMCDGEGSMYSPEFRERKQAVINHRKWLDIAAVLGCHSIRCNAGHGNVPAEEAMKCAADSFYELSQYAKQYGLNVIIENHGGISSDAKWLTGLMKMVGEDNFGTLPDFGNFPPDYDKYMAVEMMMPYAKAVSAKCHEFGPDGKEVNIDYARMMQIVFNAGYHGYVGVEYEGSKHTELEGTEACVKLLKTFQA